MKKAFEWFVVSMVYFVGILLVIGFFKFPTAPMKLCSQGYCDKMGNVITENTYNLFLYWQIAFVVSFTIVFTYAIICAISNKFD
jgi:hypothetical protein